MIVYRAYIHLGNNEWGNELMQKVAEAYAAERAEKRILVVEVLEHAGWFLSFLYGAPGIRDGAVCGTANDLAVLPKSILDFGACIDAETFLEDIRRP